SGVNPDAIGADLRGHRRCVAVDDEFSVFSLIDQEYLSNVQQILSLLTIERHARPYAGMTEEIVTDRRRGLKTGKERPMMLGETSLEFALNLFEIASDKASSHVNSIGVQGFETTEAAPSFQNLVVFKEAQQKVLVIAF